VGVQIITIMNIIKIENVKEVEVRHNRITTLNNFKMDSTSNKSVIVIMNINDMEDISLIDSLRGFYISCIVIPKGTCLSVEIERLLSPCFKQGRLSISYY
jgi:hypothetical protein